MNSSQDEKGKYSLESASGNGVSATSTNRITENLIFVIDFANISLENEISGKFQLKHSYPVSASDTSEEEKEYRDIMEYVTSEKQDDDNVTYNLFNPVISTGFTVSPDNDGIGKFNMSIDKTSYYSKDSIKAEISIVADKDYLNTQYDEREYAVKLTLLKKKNSSDENGSTTEKNKYEAVKFPDGTIFNFNGEKLRATDNNESVIIPVKKVGTYNVEIVTSLIGFELDEYQIQAELYSSSAANYYNSLITTEKDSDEFTVIANPTYAINVTNSGSSVLQRGDTLNISIQTKATNVESNTVNVNIYKYEGGDKYDLLSGLDTVFVTASSSITVNETATWTPTISDSAARGTYRLEFKYGDKVEYLDFIIK
jgi:hypothetical protein